MPNLNADAPSEDGLQVSDWFRSVAGTDPSTLAGTLTEADLRAFLARLNISADATGNPERRSEMPRRLSPGDRTVMANWISEMHGRRRRVDPNVTRQEVREAMRDYLCQMIRMDGPEMSTADNPTFTGEPESTIPVRPPRRRPPHDPSSDVPLPEPDTENRCPHGFRAGTVTSNHERRWRSDGAEFCWNNTGLHGQIVEFTSGGLPCCEHGYFLPGVNTESPTLGCSYEGCVGYRTN